MSDIVNELYRKPKKDKGVNAPTFQSYPPGMVQQADLLFLPDDDGKKYALVVVDIGSRLTDAEPMKDKKSSNIVKALKKIYARKKLKIPRKIEVDSGTEFKGETLKWLKQKKVKVRVAKPYRHRQQAIVERKNQYIGKELFKRMTAQEILTGETSRQWVDDLPEVIDKLNKMKSVTKKRKPTGEYKCEGDACTIIPEGTKVRVALDAPIDVISGKRLTGRFRDTDIRYEIKPKTVNQIIIQPDQPPMYLVDDGNGKTDHGQAYTKSQLLPVKANETQPSSSKIRPIKEKGIKKYVIDKLLERKKDKGKIVFLVKWKGFKEKTFEKRSTLIKDVPHLVKQFESLKS
jgi:hypothetical protein